MCLGVNDPGGPARCSNDACKMRDRALAANQAAHGAVAILSAEDTYDRTMLDSLELQARHQAGDTLTGDELTQLGIIDGPGSPAADSAEIAAVTGADERAAHYKALDQARAEAAAEAAEARLTARERAASAERADLIAAAEQAQIAEQAAEDQWEQAKNSDDPAVTAAAHDQLQDAYYNRLVADQALGRYDDITAQYIAAGVTRQPPPWRQDQLGAAELVTDAAPGTAEHAEALQTGIRGAHVGVAAGAKDDTSKLTVTDAKNATIDPVDPEALDRQARQLAGHTGRDGRAAAYKAHQLNDQALEALDSETSIAATPGVWRNKERPWQTAEIDAVILDDDGQPTSAMLMRTIDRRHGWPETLPPHLHAEALNALDTTGMSEATVYLSSDDHSDTPHPYLVRADEPLAGTKNPVRMPEAREQLAKRWDTWQAEKNNPAGPKLNNGTFTWTKAPKAASGHAKNAAVARDLAAYRGISQQQAHDMIAAEVAAGKKPDDAVRGLYKSYQPTADPDRKYMVFDLETNHLSAGRGEIIQTGAVVMNGRGEVTERIDQLHGIDPRAARTIGTGATDVHRIDYGAVHGRPRFRDSTARARVAELLDDPNTTLVAHNAGFETRYLAAHGIKTDRVIDTMSLSRRFDHNSPGSRLENFTATHGVAYEDAHNAYSDAEMTARALLGFWRTHH